MESVRREKRGDLCKKYLLSGHMEHHPCSHLRMGRTGQLQIEIRKLLHI